MVTLRIEQLVDITRKVMAELGIEDHLPNLTQLCKHGHVTEYTVKKLGGLQTLSLLMGLPFAPRNVPPTYNTTRNDNKEFVSRKKPTPSKAFQIQAEKGMPWGEIQKAQTLEMAGKIDLSQYAGMKTYAERTTNG